LLSLKPDRSIGNTLLVYTTPGLGTASFYSIFQIHSNLVRYRGLNSCCLFLYTVFCENKLLTRYSVCIATGQLLKQKIRDQTDSNGVN
jgi:hypothetical protein